MWLPFLTLVTTDTVSGLYPLGISLPHHAKCEDRAIDFGLAEKSISCLNWLVSQLVMGRECLLRGCFSVENAQMAKMCYEKFSHCGQSFAISLKITATFIRSP
jgi:hypothetical protein